MKPFILAVAAALASLSLTSCLQHEAVIHLNKDGSGTLVEETTIGAQMEAMMDQMAAMGGAGGGRKDPLAGMFSEEKARARATTLGEGVTLEKNEAIEKAGNKGGRATFHFADINRLKISPSDSLKDLSPMGGMAAPKKKPAKPIDFKYADGTLTIAMPRPKPDEGKPAVAPAGDRAGPGEQEIGMMKQMMGDMKISFKIVIEPGIAETNATYRDGNSITLVDVEMGKMFERPEVVKKLGTIDRKDPTAALELMKGIPGVKLEAVEVVTVKLN
ncbi:MAG: hypothetical protein ABI600_05965 [Luteolibacter sp.]